MGNLFFNIRDSKEGDREFYDCNLGNNCLTVDVSFQAEDFEGIFSGYFVEGIPFVFDGEYAEKVILSNRSERLTNAQQLTLERMVEQTSELRSLQKKYDIMKYLALCSDGQFEAEKPQSIFDRKEAVELIEDGKVECLENKR
jgi:predicted sulfurtransferase